MASLHVTGIVLLVRLLVRVHLHKLAVLRATIHDSCMHLQAHAVKDLHDLPEQVVYTLALCVPAHDCWMRWSGLFAAACHQESMVSSNMDMPS